MTIRSGPKTLATAALAVGLAALSGCSLLFDESPSSATFDAGALAVDAAADAADTPVCGVSLGGTIGHFTTDGEGGRMELTDNVAGKKADSVTKDSGSNTLVLTPLAAQAGPIEPCGEAAALSGDSSSFIRIASDTFPAPRSVDFWFNTVSIPNGGELGALLGKEATGNLPGDMGLYIFQAAPLNGIYHVLLRLQDGEGNSYFGCSKPVELGAWNHLAVSFDSTEGVRLFVNGELAQEGANVDVPDSANLGNTICGDDSPASTATLDDNTHDWLWGAGNHNAPGNVARDVTTGALDELRLRNEPFTLEDAQAVYESIAGS